MKRELKVIEEMERDIDFIEEVLKNSDRNLVCFRASEKKGILPHQIADGSLLFVERDALYSEGDFILIKDRRLGKNGMRITKALNKKDEHYFGKLVLSVKRFDMGV
ncbi:hypothetical protein HMPREF1142_1741 [Peptostreptococcaceae bacterium AS15]|nr:hypothetical protein HMPREF1142_1741 [Peptostreptococcaceae bacterium AS15]